MNSSENLKKKDKNLPWWVELLFVQIGLPEKLLIKILKAKNKAKELIKNDKKSLISFYLYLLHWHIFIQLLNIQKIN